MRHCFEVGEFRYIWLDEDGERTSQYHKTVGSAFTYRKMLNRHLDGERVWAPARREAFKPQGSGKRAQRLVKVTFVQQEVELNDEDQADLAACERLARTR